MSNADTAGPGAHLRLSRYLDRLSDQCDKHEQYVRDSRQLIVEWEDLHTIIDRLADELDELFDELSDQIKLLTEERDEFHQIALGFAAELRVDLTDFRDDSYRPVEVQE